MSTAPRLLIVGPLPPPKGGVSIHIERLIALLARRDMAIETIDESPVRKAEAFNLRSLNVFGYMARFRRSDVVHIHSSVDLFRIVNAITAIVLRKQFLITLHSWRPRGAFSSAVHRWIFRRAGAVICVSQRIAAEVAGAKVLVRPAFIPPDMAAEPSLPPDVEAWLTRQKAMGNTLIASNAYQLDTFEQNDIYGTDLCIEMMHALVHRKGRKAALIFNVASLASGRDIFDRYLRRIEALNLVDNVLLINEPQLSFVRLLEHTDLSIRATNTDGDAMSVREALYLGRPVVASDAASRPEGTRLFESRCVTSLLSAVEAELDARECNTSSANATTDDDSPEFYMGLYAGANAA